jgi:uncharacterized protein with PIN domain
MARYQIDKEISEFNKNRCFVCNVRLTTLAGPRKRTLEHLIPQWLIRKFALHEQTVTMGRLGKFRYMDYLLPCCSGCNSHLLAPIERAVSRSLRSNNPKGLNEKRLAPWAAKIIAGVQLYDRAERMDRSKWSSGESLIRDYLGGLRGKIFVTHRNQFEYAMSIFWLKTKVRSDVTRNFDFQVSPYLQCLYLRLGQWSLLARADAGYIRRNGSHIFEEYLDEELAPLQVEELAAHFFTMAELAKGDHGLTRVKLPNGITRVERIQIPVREPFREEGDDGSVFVKWFAHLTGAPGEALLLGGGRRWTCLKYDSGEHLNVPADAGWH